MKIKKSKKKLSNGIKGIKFKVKKQKEYKKKRKIHIGKIILGLILICGIGILLAGLVFILYIIIASPEFDTTQLYKTSSSILYDKDGNEFARLGTTNRELVTYSDLPQVFIDALVATEDSRFFQHDGFDIARFVKASLGQLAGQDAGGASTITMQVIGVSGLTNRNTASGIKGIIRKFTDIYLAVFKLEKQYTKEEIIEFYVNTPWLGNNTSGVEMASQYYFGKSVRDLGLAESAILVGLFNAPSAYNPYSNPEGCKTRMNEVLELMYRHGYITEDQLNDAKNISVESLITTNSSSGLNSYQWFIDTVREEIIEDTGKDPMYVAMKIYTTMDASVQDEVNKAGNTTTYYGWNHTKNDKEQMAVAITSVTDGSLVAIYGGRNQKGMLELNRATSTSYQPGSAAKPIIDYGPAIEYGNASTGTYYLDEPMTYSNGQNIKNAEGTYLGMISMRTALARSRNIPALQAFQSVDKDKIASFAHSLGIDYGDTLYESFSIGSFDTVSALQLSAAYAAFGRGGYYIEPYSYTKIEFIDTDGDYSKEIKKQKVMSDSTAYMITDILVYAQSTYKTGGSYTVSGTDIATKTGTSTYDGSATKGFKKTPSRDNWTVSYSPDYSISLWYGYDKLDTENKTDYTDIWYAQSVKKKLMIGMGKAIFKKNSKFTKPDSVVSVEVEKDTIPLQLPSEDTPSNMRITELFKKGTEPTETSIRYQTLDTPTNGTATTNGNTVYLSWDAIETPKAIDTDYLKSYFEDNYVIQATKYYEKRLSYNNQYIGEVRYSVYVENNGEYQFLAEVSDTNYTFQGNAGTTYKFAIQANYSIFKDNASAYLIIKATTSGTSGDKITLKLSNDDECHIASTNSYYTDDTKITAYDINGTNITSKLTDITTTITLTDEKTGKVSTIGRINLATKGTYKITYSVTYNGKTYTTSRTFIISDTCN